jgi:hypothetical protein
MAGLGCWISPQIVAWTSTDYGVLRAGVLVILWLGTFFGHPSRAFASRRSINSVLFRIDDCLEVSSLIARISVYISRPLSSIIILSSLEAHLRKRLC